jgi:CheY-like chemotaxis protein
VIQVHTKEGGRQPSAIEVRDTGIGIPPERLQAIFEAFQQADGSTSRKYGGTGLGLTISRSLCQLMGYELKVESREGEGSSFTILLHGEASPEKRAKAELMEEALRPMESSRPRREGETPSLGPSHDGAGPVPFHRPRILVIDDDPDTRVLLRHQLEELGCDVTTSESAMEGVERARAIQPELITLDLLMPGMTGWEALKVFKEDPAVQDIPVVIVSVVAGEEDRGNLLGAVDLLTKPVHREDLLRVLKRNLDDPKGRRVLVVEDDLDTQALFREYLEDAGLEVRVAANGEEAGRALKAEHPDLILLDLIMPVMDGTAFLQQLRRDPDNVEIPVIICTGKELSMDERRRLLSEATEIVHKGNGFEESLMAVLSSFFTLGGGSGT